MLGAIELGEGKGRIETPELVVGLPPENVRVCGANSCVSIADGGEIVMLGGLCLYCVCGRSLLLLGDFESLRPAGRLDTGRKSDEEAVCGLLPTSRDGLGPNFTFGLPLEPYEEYEKRSGRVDCEDLRRPSSMVLVGDSGRVTSRLRVSRGGGGVVSRSAIMDRYAVEGEEVGASGVIAREEGIAEIAGSVGELSEMS